MSQIEFSKQYAPTKEEVIETLLNGALTELTEMHTAAREFLRKLTPFMEEARRKEVRSAVAALVADAYRSAISANLRDSL